MSNNKTQPFFSIKWKALLLFGFLLGLSHSAQYFLSYKQITNQFQQQHYQEQKNQFAIIQTLISQSARVMEQIADISMASPSTTTNHIINTLDQQWESLQDNWAIASISFYNKDNQLEKTFGLQTPNLIPKNNLSKAFQLEEPAYKLFCDAQCYQVVYIPILTNKESSLLVFVRSLADIIITFEQTTQSDIAILKPTPSRHHNQVIKLEITASTHPKEMRTFFSQLNQQRSIQALLSEEVTITSTDNKIINLHLYEFAGDSGPSSPYLLLATDITENHRLIDEAKTDSLYIILLTLAFSMAVIFPVLLNRTQRLIQVSNLLPSLAQGNFQQVRQFLEKKRPFQWRSDEVDILESATLLVTQRLEKGNQRIKETNDSLVWLADHDPLTQLFNRRRFQSEFEQQLDFSERYKNHGAILYLDLDQFKYINDTSGHAVGDILLKKVAEALQHIVRCTDVLARLGGDEFALLMPDTDIDGASKTAQKILDALHSIHFMPNGNQHTITGSIGITIFPEKGLNAHDFMSNADIAMYQAKESGRGKAHIYSHAEQTKEKIKKRVLWKEKIESALMENRLVLYFQPILDIKSNSISHVEALVRMIDKDGSIIMPNDFIPTAEQSGLINQIDMAVLNLAFETLRTLHLKNSPLKLSINFSGKAFNNNLLITHLKDGLSKNDINAEKLIIEVTETTAVANFNNAVQMMNDIKKLGVKFALDDFGVGYASFFYLRQLPVDYVKIDGSFIQQLENNQEDQVLVKAIAEISKLSGKKTVAEFVENQAILDLLKKYNIDYAQGYHIAKPSAEIPTMG